MNRNSVAPACRSRVPASTCATALRGTAARHSGRRSRPRTASAPWRCSRLAEDLEEGVDADSLDLHLVDCDTCRLSRDAMEEAGLSYRSWAPVAAVPLLFRETVAQRRGDRGASDRSDVDRAGGGRRSLGRHVRSGCRADRRAHAGAACSWRPPRRHMYRPSPLTDAHPYALRRSPARRSADEVVRREAAGRRRSKPCRAPRLRWSAVEHAARSCPRSPADSGGAGGAGGAATRRTVPQRSGVDRGSEGAAVASRSRGAGGRDRGGALPEPQPQPEPASAARTAHEHADAQPEGAACPPCLPRQERSVGRVSG